MTKEERRESRNVYFFHLKAQHKYKKDDGNISLEAALIDSALDKVMSLDFSEDENKTAVFKHGYSFIAMRIDEKNGNYYAGQIANVREKSFPKGLKDGKLVPLNFQGMKLYEPSHFVYFADSKILCLEYNSHAPRHAAFAAYIEKISKKFGLKPNTVGIEYDLGKETVDRFVKSAGKVKSLKLTVPIHSYSTKPKGTLMAMLDGVLSSADASRMGQVTMEIKFGVAETENAQNPSPEEIERANKSDIADLWRNAGVDFTSFFIDMDGSQDVDFINDKIRQELSVKITDLGHVDTSSIHDEIRAAYTARYTQSK